MEEKDDDRDRPFPARSSSAVVVAKGRLSAGVEAKLLPLKESEAQSTKKPPAPPLSQDAFLPFEIKRV